MPAVSAHDPLELLEAEDRLVRTHERLCCELRQIFRDIVLLDQAEAWRTDGATSMADWLSYRCALSQRTTVEWVEISHALVKLPHIADAFDQGRFSYDQIRWLARLATREEDAKLAAEAQGTTPKALEAMYYRRQRLTRKDAEDAHEARSLKTRWSHRKRMLRFWGQLPEADGRLFEQTLERYAERAPRDAEMGTRMPLRHLYADALVELVSEHAGSAPDPDRANIVVHVPVEALMTGKGNGELDNGVQLSNDTVLRLACDARLQAILVDSSANALAAGRMTRTVPPRLSRELRRRDQACRFPGCGRKRGLIPHHIHHYAHGGPTTADNLILLCRYHHWLVHEGGWRLRLTGTGRVIFIRKDGRALRTRPDALDPARIRQARARAP
jgi:hypothetical protein